jgi:hypothetical protein
MRGFERHFDSPINRTTKESNCAIGIFREPFSRLGSWTAVTEPIGTAHKRRASEGTGRVPVPFLFAAQAAGLRVTNAPCWKRVSPRTLHASGSQAREESLAPQATEAP